MRRRRRDPLLCELHAHSRWSDGVLSIRELVDLYGQNGFDVLCVTDHLVRAPEGAMRPRGEITAHSYGWYLEAIAAYAVRKTGHWAANPQTSSTLVDRFELFNRHELFAWVAERRLPSVASGDFHQPEHLLTWKTLLPCPKDETAIVDYLRSDQPAYLVHLAQPNRLRAAA